MKQTGFLYKEDSKNYVLGVNSPLQSFILNSSGDWIDFVPLSEKQHNYNFDTMCCSTFSATSALETLLNYLMSIGELSKEQIKFCKEEGYIIDGKFNFSDRWSAISNGTMPNGQYLPVVWDDFRVNSLIPEKDLPFGGNNQSEYLDKSLITEKSKDKAKRFGEIMFEKENNGKYKINYEWVPIETGVELYDALKQAPIQVAVTKENPQHAILLVRMDKEFESYSPFLRQRNRSLAYALKPSVKIKKTMQKDNYVEITRTQSDSKQTLGILEAYNNGAKFTCKTLELGWKNNLKNISSIPAGEYIVKWTFSPRFLKYTYEVQNVKNRDGIRIHPANYYYQLNGCIALGSNLVNLDSDDKLDISNSKKTISAFENFMNKESFVLKIV